MPGSLWKSFRPIAASFCLFNDNYVQNILFPVDFGMVDAIFGTRNGVNCPKLHLFTPGSFCPSPIPPTPGQPCNLPGALDCHYENHIDNHGLAGNCCCGQCDIDMTCAPDSTTGSGLWQPKHPMLCPTKGCGSEGEWWREIVREKMIP